MPHILTAVLSNVAIALLEAVLMRLAVQLWKAFAASRGPAAARA
ncbi:hypothetical protein ACIBU0_14615 [Streptomyces sp. NPDC049627]